MKKRFLFIILLLFLFNINVYAYEPLTPTVDNTQKIWDYANLLNDSDEADLKTKIDEYIAKTNFDLVVVTIDNNPYSGYDAPINYAMDFYDYNGYGIDKHRSGVIILIDMQNREIIFDRSGEGLLYYDDERGQVISDSIAEYLKTESYLSGLKEGIRLSQECYDSGIPESNDDFYINENGEYVKRIEVKEKKVNFVASFVVGLLGSGLIVLIHLKKYKQIKEAKYANDYMVGENNKKKVDQFQFTNTTRVRVNNDSSNRGSFGGGTSTRIGGSGRSHSSSRSKF